MTSKWCLWLEFMFDDINLGLERSYNSLAMWRQSLTEPIISSIEWDLPASIDILYPERSLFNNGKIIFFELDGQLVCSNGVQLGQMNLYGDYYQRKVVAPNGFTIDLTADNSVLCWNNVSKKAERNRCEYYAKRIAALDQIIDGNAYAQKTPIIFAANDADQLSMQNAIARYDANVPVIKVTQEFNPDAIRTLNATTDYKGNQLRETQIALINEYMSANGIFHTGKDERVLVAELAMENFMVEMNQQAKLRPRQQACDQINDMFGHLLDKPVSVKMAKGIEAIALSGNIGDKVEKTNLNGGDENG